MASPLGTRMAGCAWIALAMLAGMSGAKAETGRIVFSGAVVVPTCTAGLDSAVAMASKPISDRSFICGVPSQATGHVDASIYRFSVVLLDDATIAGSPLLQYFIGYRVSMHAADAKLVTRIYE